MQPSAIKVSLTLLTSASLPVSHISVMCGAGAITVVLAGRSTEGHVTKKQRLPGPGGRVAAKSRVTHRSALVRYGLILRQVPPYVPVYSIRYHSTSHSTSGTYSMYDA